MFLFKKKRQYKSSKHPKHQNATLFQTTKWFPSIMQQRRNSDRPFAQFAPQLQNICTDFQPTQYFHSSYTTGVSYKTRRRRWYQMTGAAGGVRCQVPPVVPDDRCRRWYQMPGAAIIYIFSHDGRV